MAHDRKPKATQPTPYERTPADLAALEAYRARRRSRDPSGSIKASQSGSKRELRTGHPDQHVGFAILANEINTGDADFLHPLVCQLNWLAELDPDQNSETGTNFALAVIRSVRPRDEIEAMLAAQMAAAHLAVTLAAERLGRADTLPRFEAYERAFNRLSRTFVAQVEALAKLRNGGKQVVEVKHYDVRGQNVVFGDIHHGGGGGVRDGNPAQPLEPRSIASDPGETIPPLWGKDATGDAVSVPDDARETPL